MNTGFYDRTPEPQKAAAEVEPYPAPEVSSRAGVQGPAKDAVKAARLLAQAHGWDTLVTYSRGCLPHGTTGAPGPVRDVLMLRLHRGAERAYASYVSGAKSWSWDSMASWRTDAAGSWTGYDTIGLLQDRLFGIDHGPRRPFRVVRKVCFFRVPAMGTRAYGPVAP